MTRETKQIALGIVASAIAATGAGSISAALVTGDWRWLLVALLAYLLVRRT